MGKFHWRDVYYFAAWEAASPTFTHVHAALFALINTKLPKIDREPLVTRLIIQFRRGVLSKRKTNLLF